MGKDSERIDCTRTRGLERRPAAGAAALLLVALMVSGCAPEAGDVVVPDPAPAPVAERAEVRIDNALGGWIPSGVEIAAGDAVALFGDGVVEVGVGSASVAFGPRYLLWYRVGTDGQVREFAADQEAFTATESGELFLAFRPAGFYWSDRRGTFPAAMLAAPPVPVDMRVEVLRLALPLRDALTALADDGEGEAAAALEFLDNRKQLPAGFEPLWYVTAADVWADGTVDGRPGIHADTDDDASIVRMPLDLPLTDDTTIEFAWRYDAIPALGPETDAGFHDYLSIAVEFDNGQDLTWIWSRELPVGTHFECPLPGWEGKEYHWVLQSGSEGLGTWFDHERPLLADFRAAIGGEAPSRIVGVWFIANSQIGRQRGAASFAEVAIVGGGERTEIFAAAP